MTESELSDRLRRRNQLNLVLGVFLAVGAVVAWWLTFWIARILAWLALYGFDSLLGTGWSLSRVSWWIAMGVIGLLIIEGIQLGRSAGAIGDYFQRRPGWTTSQWVRGAKLDSSLGLGPRQWGTGASVGYDPMAGTTYMISQVLFFAPQATVQAFGMLTSRLPVHGQPVWDAVALLETLARDRTWRDADDYDARAVMLLHRLKLIWLRERDGLTEIRIPPKSDDCA